MRLRSLCLLNVTTPSVKRKERVVAADADVGSRVEPRPALAHENVSGDHPLAAEALYAQALGVGVAPVTGRAGALLRCKKLKVELKHSRPIVAKTSENATSRFSSRRSF